MRANPCVHSLSSIESIDFNRSFSCLDRDSVIGLRNDSIDKHVIMDTDLTLPVQLLMKQVCAEMFTIYGQINTFIISGSFALFMA